MSQEEVMEGPVSSGAGRLPTGRPLLLGKLGVIGAVLLVYAPILYYMMLHWKAVDDYSHGFLIVPLAIYFAWEKWPQLQRAPAEGSWLGLIPLGAGAGALTVGRLGVELMSMRMGFVLTLIGMVLLLFGRQVTRILAFPLCFLFLMVPLPQSLVNIIAFPLQLIAASAAVWTLHLLHIPALLEGNIIHLANTQLFVAEACSGLRSLMALLTLGVVFAHFFRKGRPIQQLVIVVSTFPIAILVNAIRVAITGFLTYHHGVEAAGGFIHEFQGMITFSVAFVLLLAEARLLNLLWPATRRASPPQAEGRA
ncbi:MAG: exosortase/archaeosortase family protein [Deltaproteobacteria bacterium]|nr:exosortase/archaeosortase family protein [Deltaproteobacteria bacterium]